jgi:ABC-2 type transport system permease protein
MISFGIGNIRRELVFLAALWKVNLLAAMEFRAAFLTQVIGMMLNNAVYFLFWIIFFDRFKEVRGWVLSDMFLLFGIVAAGFGMASYLFGNALTLADIITGGRLDYYLALPRPVLLHTLASRSFPSGAGDFLYGCMSFFAAGSLRIDTIGRFTLGVLIAASIFLSFLVIVQSIAFWSGSAQMLGPQAMNAIITFAIYPITLFEGGARFLLFTIIPAALVGAVPAEFVRNFSWEHLLLLLGASIIFVALALAVFYRGLKRYESGSAFQIQI